MGLSRSTRYSLFLHHTAAGSRQVLFRQFQTKCSYYTPDGRKYSAVRISRGICWVLDDGISYITPQKQKEKPSSGLLLRFISRQITCMTICNSDTVHRTHGIRQAECRHLFRRHPRRVRTRIPFHQFPIHRTGRCKYHNRLADLICAPSARRIHCKLRNPYSGIRSIRYPRERLFCGS